MNDYDPLLRLFRVCQWVELFLMEYEPWADENDGSQPPEECATKLRQKAFDKEYFAIGWSHPTLHALAARLELPNDKDGLEEFLNKPYD